MDTTRRNGAMQRLGGVLLGVFIVWQLIYLSAAGAIETLEVVSERLPEETATEIKRVVSESRHGRPATAVPGLGSLIYVVDKWGQVTEQPQRWCLFAPDVAKQATFLSLELCWHDEEQSIWLDSDNEPADPTSFFRIGRNRSRSFEQRLSMEFELHVGETVERARERWRARIAWKLADEYELLAAFATVRLDEFQRANPDIPRPDFVIFHVRGYQIAPPNSESVPTSEPYQLPLARWVPDAEYPADVLPIEAYDPVADEFAALTWSTEDEQ